MFNDIGFQITDANRMMLKLIFLVMSFHFNVPEYAAIENDLGIKRTGKSSSR